MLDSDKHKIYYINSGKVVEVVKLSDTKKLSKPVQVNINLKSEIHTRRKDGIFHKPDSFKYVHLWVEQFCYGTQYWLSPVQGCYKEKNVNA